MKTVYLFQPDTREYLGIYEAQESPEEPGDFIVPTDSCDDAPPAAAANTVAVRSAANDAWVMQPDYRGQTIYDQASSASQVIEVIGAIPSGWALTQSAAQIAAAAWTAFRGKVQIELDFSDGVATRCWKAAVPYPADWLARDQRLRVLRAATSGDPTQAIEARPAFPAGT